MNPPTDDGLYRIVCFLLLGLLVLLLPGCGSTRTEKAQIDTVRQETTVIDCTVPFPRVTATGWQIVDIPLRLTMKRNSTEVAKRDATQQTTIDAPELGAAFKLALSQLAPGLGALMTPTPTSYTPEIIGGGTTALMAILALLKAKSDAKTIEFHKQRADTHKAGEDEAYDMLIERQAATRKTEPIVVPPRT